VTLALPNFKAEARAAFNWATGHRVSHSCSPRSILSENSFPFFVGRAFSLKIGTVQVGFVMRFKARG